MNKWVKIFDGLDHQYNPEENLHQIEPYTIFTIGKKHLDPVAFKQWHKKRLINIALYLEPLSAGFHHFMELEKTDWSAFASAFKKKCFEENCILRTS